MENNQTYITVEAMVDAPLHDVWKAWTTPADITQWNFASPDWHCPMAENDLKAGGIFMSRMAAKDGSFSFDFSGTHDEVVHHAKISSTMGDGRKMSVVFTPIGNSTLVTESFNPESENTLELQKAGWQAILDNFKRYTEGK